MGNLGPNLRRRAEKTRSLSLLQDSQATAPGGHQETGFANRQGKLLKNGPNHLDDRLSLQNPEPQSHKRHAGPITTRVIFFHQPPAR